MRKVTIKIFFFLILLFCSDFAQQLLVVTDEENGLVNNNEPCVSINPNNSENIVVVTNRRKLNNEGLPVEYRIGIYTTTDGGISWSKLVLPGDNARQADPSICYSKSDGRFYVGYLQYGNQLPSAIKIAQLNYNGTLVENVFNISVSPEGTNIDHDKPFLSVDNSPISPNYGNVYIAYLKWNAVPYSAPNKQYIRWIKPDGKLSSEYLLKEVNGILFCPIPRTNKNGEIFISYLENIGLGFYVSCDRANIMDNYFTNETIKQIPIELIGRDEDGARYLGQFNKDFRVNNFPTLALFNENVFLIYPNYNGDNSDLYLCKSNDNGNTWDTPINITNSIEEEFFPYLDISDEGKIVLVYYNLNKNADSNLAVHLKMSINNGKSFYGIGSEISSFSYTDNDWEIPRNGRNNDPNDVHTFIGDYIGIAVDSDNIISVWTSVTQKGVNYPEIIKAMKLPNKISVTLETFVNGHIVVNNDFSQPYNNGATAYLDPFVDSEFYALEEYDEGLNNKFRNWNKSFYSSMDIFNRKLNYYITIDDNASTFKALYDKIYPLTVTNYLEGGSGGSYSVTWQAANKTETLNSGEVYYAFEYNITNQDKYNIIVEPTIQSQYGTDWYFKNWDDGSTNTTITDLAVTAPATRTAYYKGNMRSDNSAAFSNNNQRKIVRTADGTLHLVYESMGKIWRLA